MLNEVCKRNLLRMFNIFIILLTCLWFIPLYNKGIDLSDTSYYLVKYKYFFDSSVDVRGMSTFFTDLLGSIIYHVVPSHQLLILNITSAGCYTVSGYLIFYILKDFAPRTALLFTTFGCSLLSLSYIHCFNYNTASMFNLSLAIALLTAGLFKSKYRYILCSGFVCAVNIFFRTPNALHLCMFFGIILYCYNRESHKWRDCYKPALMYVGGCLVGAAISSILLIAVLGWGDIKNYINNTLLTLTDSTGGHSTDSMLGNLRIQIDDGIRLWRQYAMVLLLIIVIAFFLCFIIKNHRKIVLICAGIISLLYGVYVKSAIEITTESASSNSDIKNTFCFILIAVMILSLVGVFAFFLGNRQFSYLCLVTFMLECVITFGTDTGALYNTVFLYLPVGMLCCLLYQYYVLLRGKRIIGDLAASTGVVVASFSLMLLFFSGYYRGTTYVYRDSPYSELTSVCNITPLEGIYTSSERADLIYLIQEQLQPFQGYSLITFGDCNIAAVISDLKPYFSVAWPDLRSFSEEDYYEQLQKCSETGNYPVIMFSKTTIVTYTGRLEGKEQMLLEFI